VLDPHVSTRGEAGRIVLTVLGMVAQMERRFIKERQREGIERAKADGVYRGGKRRLDRQEVRSMRAAGLGPSAIATALGCSRMQVYRILADTISHDRTGSSKSFLQNKLGHGSQSRRARLSCEKVFVHS
jgi:DNA invertase Pin-like site-specific DNA recombinase